MELDELVRLEGVSAEDDADRVLGHLDHGAQGQHLVTVIVHEVQNLNMNWSVNKRNKQDKKLSTKDQERRRRMSKKQSWENPSLSTMILFAMIDDYYTRAENIPSRRLKFHNHI